MNRALEFGRNVFCENSIQAKQETAVIQKYIIHKAKLQQSQFATVLLIPEKYL